MAQSIVKIFTHKFFKISTAVVILFFLSFGISSVADDNIKSATNNFSAMGLVSEISEDGITIIEAKGSDGSGQTVYELNIKNLDKMETNKNTPLNFIDIQPGDKIIVQGLTNGSTFFVKRIISFTSTPTPIISDKSIATSTATTTEEVVATSTATTTDEVASTSTATTTEGESLSTTTSTTTEDVATTTPSVTDNVVEAVQTVTETISDVVENIIEAVTNPDLAPAPSTE